MKSLIEDTSASVASLRQPILHDFHAMWGPPQFTNWVEESMSWKESCYIGDWSFIPSRLFKGPDAFKLFSDLSVNTMQNFQVGQSKHLIECNKDGKIVIEGILSRISDDELMAFIVGELANFVARKGGYDVSSELVPLTKYHLQGPNSLYVLERLAGENLRDIRFMRFRDIEILGHKVTALRQGMTGEIGFELHAPLEHGRKIWDAIVDAGQDFGIRQMGGRVSMLNHLEASYPTHALDYMPAIFDEPYDEYRRSIPPEYLQSLMKIAGSFESDDIRDWYRSPIELGWGNRIKFDHEFVGREALAKELANPRRAITTLVWNSDDVVNAYGAFFRKGTALPEFMEMPRESRGYLWTDKVLKDGKLVGISTSRGYSAYFREMLSLCTIDIGYSKPGTEVTLIWGNPGQAQKEIRAVVQRAPYKQDRGRVDFSTLPSYLNGGSASRGI